LKESEETDVLHSDGLQGLGYVYEKRREFLKAEEYFGKAFNWREKNLGSQDLETLNSAHGIGRVLKEQGKFSDAKGWYMQVLEGRMKSFGSEHVWHCGPRLPFHCGFMHPTSSVKLSPMHLRLSLRAIHST
jgi:tetratricopeptide (TPR) repeat protein